MHFAAHMGKQTNRMHHHPVGDCTDCTAMHHSENTQLFFANVSLFIEVIFLKTPYF
jgi:hypothetical protein